MANPWPRCEGHLPCFAMFCHAFASALAKHSKRSKYDSQSLRSLSIPDSQTKTVSICCLKFRIAWTAAVTLVTEGI